MRGKLHLIIIGGTVFLAGTEESRAMGTREIKIGGWAGVNIAELNSSGFDNDGQSDPFGFEDASTVRFNLQGTNFGTNFRYEWTLENYQTNSKDLTAGMDVQLNDKIAARFEVFSPGFQKLSYTRITGAKLTSFKLDYSLTTESYPYVEFEVEPVVPALSMNDPAPWSAGLCVEFVYDNPSDAVGDKGQTVLVTNAPPVDLGDALHPSSTAGLGLALNFGGLKGEEAEFSYYASASYAGLWSAGLNDYQGGINGRTPPDGNFDFSYLGDPASLGITIDLGTGVVGETYGAYHMKYQKWDGNDDVQFGISFAPRDFESDGLPNDWEDANGFDKNVKDTPLISDKDGDKFPDYSEWLAGTDPCDPNSLLRIIGTMFHPTTKNYMFEWDSVPGKLYDVNYMPSGSMTWMPLPGGQNIPAAIGTSTSHTHLNAPVTGGDTALYQLALSVSF